MGAVARFFGMEPSITAASPLVASPWTPQPNHLNSVVWPDLLGQDINFPMTRTEAMMIPAMARGRGLITTTIGRLPLTLYGRQDTPIEAQPQWLTKTQGPITAFHRTLWTVDDLLFYGWSLWSVVRDSRGLVTDATRVNFDAWEFDSNGRIKVNGEYVTERQVILFAGVNEGVLDFGRRTLRQHSDLLAAADRAARNPNAYIELHDTGDQPMTTTEIDDLTARWSKARRGENGGVAYTNKTVEVKEHGAASEHLLIQGRNAAAVDVARLLGVPAAMLDAQAQTGSLTYQTTQDQNAQMLDYGLAPFLAAISSRLSQDDVTASGNTVGFELERFLGTVAPSSTKTQDERVPDSPEGSGVSAPSSSASPASTK